MKISLMEENEIDLRAILMYIVFEVYQTLASGEGWQVRRASLCLHEGCTMSYRQLSGIGSNGLG